jgi:pilus assembly protein CpaB
MRFLLLFIAAVIAVFAGIAAMHLSSPTPAANTASMAMQPASGKVATVDVLVAREAIAPGTVITSAMFDKQPWPEHLVLDGFIVSGTPAANIVGKVARTSFQAREPLLSNKLAPMNESGFLAANLPSGMHAITIPTDAITGVAGFVFPGDHVDILFTHNIPGDLKAEASADSAAAARPASDRPGYAEVLAANIPVLAINLREQDEKDNSGAAPVASAAASITPSSMTLQVTELQAEQIRLAEKVGTLSVSLRSLHDRDDNTTAPPTSLASLTQQTVNQCTASDDTVKVIRKGQP